MAIKRKLSLKPQNFHSKQAWYYESHNSIGIYCDTPVGPQFVGRLPMKLLKKSLERMGFKVTKP